MVDIRIFGVEKRVENIAKNKRILDVPDDHIFIDYNMDGVLPTARRAYCFPTSESHVLVLQDDVELCDGFMDICNRIVVAQPSKIVSLFPFQFQRRKNISIDDIYTLPSPYVSTMVLSGCGVIMPSQYINDCFSSIPYGDDTLPDDSSINRWANRNDITVITTLPSTIQHIGDISIVDVKKWARRTVFYSQKPGSVDWDSKYVTDWRDIYKK